MGFLSGLTYMLVNSFFSTCEVVNKDNIPLDTPLIVVVNHKNQFVDAGVVHHVLPREGSFIVAEASMHRCIIGDFARMANSVPVIRPQDRAVVGQGTLIRLDLEEAVVIGLGTNFTTINILEKKAKIDIKGVCSLTVLEVISDTEVKISLSEEEKQKLEQVVDLFSNETPQKFKVLPFVDQNDVYKAVHDRLGQNGSIIIFPEGGSHDQPTLLPLKPGVAVMALGSIKAGVKNLKILPIGINYFRPDLFRSRVLVEMGEAFEVPAEIYERYEEGDRRGAYQDLMEVIKQGMFDVTLNAPDYKIQETMRTLRRLYQNGAELQANEYLSLYRRFLRGYEEWKENDQFKELLKDVKSYMKTLKSLGLNDKSLESLSQSNSCCTFTSVLFQVLFSLLITTFLLVLALPGIILNLPLICCIQRKVKIEMKKALKKSKVKLKAMDVAASQKVINLIKYFIPMYLLNSIGLTIILFFAYEQQNEDEKAFFLDNLFWLVPVILFFVFPFYTWFVAKVTESAVRRYALLPSRFYTLYTIYITHVPKCLGGKDRFSVDADIRIRRRQLVIRTQDIISDLIENDETWQNDPIIPASVMTARRKMLTRYMIEFMERKESDRNLLSKLGDQEIDEFLALNENEKKQYLQDAL